MAGGSLLVGGIGIMNLMVGAKTEPTREIGGRMAIGAKGKVVGIAFGFSRASTTPPSWITATAQPGESSPRPPGAPARSH